MTSRPGLESPTSSSADQRATDTGVHKLTQQRHSAEVGCFVVCKSIWMCMLQKQLLLPF